MDHITIKATTPHFCTSETTHTYDTLGRRTETTEPDPDGDGARTAAVTTYTYDHLSRQTRVTDAENGETDYAYDAAGRRTGLTDPEENSTEWTYGAHGQMITETITVSGNPLSRAFEYDAAGQLSRRIDRNGRVIDYTRDDLLRQTAETWYNNVTDADAAQNAVATITTDYDEASRVTEIDDGGTVLGSSYRAAGPPTTANYRSAGIGPLPLVATLFKALNISTNGGKSSGRCSRPRKIWVASRTP